MDNDLPVLTPQTPNPAYPPVPVQDAVRALLGGVGHAVGRMADLPRQAFESSENMRMGGDYNPAPVMEMATSLMGGGMPMAENGAAGIFGGMFAKNVPLLNRLKAGVMEQKGALPSDIYDATRWFRGVEPDGWKFTIPVRDASLRQGLPPATSKAEYIGNLGGWLDYPELFANYPSLRQAHMFAVPGNWSGYSAPTRKFPHEQIHWSTGGPPEERLPLLLHEVQHGVQAREGWDPGMSIELAREKGNRSLYDRNIGENEAYNVQDRKFNRVPVEIYPWSTQRHPFAEQIPSLLPKRKLGNP